MNCEYFSHEEPFPGDVFVLFLLKKNGLLVFCFFFLKKCKERFTPGSVRTNFKKCKSMNLMTYFKFECSLNDLFCVFTADVLKFIVCVNKKAILSQFQDQIYK